MKTHSQGRHFSPFSVQLFRQIWKESVVILYYDAFNDPTNECATDFEVLRKIDLLRLPLY